MPTFYDSTGKSHVLAGEIGRGGEGTVYFCEGNSELVAKIYHEPITDQKAAKLRWMAENNHKSLQKVAAWVVETLHDKPDGKVIGFLMPNINAKEIHELYSLKSRRVHFPDANWHFLIHTATNVARAFYNLQKYDHVMGDVNHGNCVVLADGTVKLIDCDSYAIKANEERYACEVGVATHLAPELQKADLSEVERLPKHDNFGLAVIIFQLLFLGRHPFSGNFLGEKDKTLEDCIREYRFAYGKLSDTKNVKQPPGTLSLDEVSPRIAELFERAFNEKQTRPNPKEWIEALIELSENLEQCSFHPGHHFYKELVSCPWCRIEGKTGLSLFPFKTNGEKSLNIYTVENLLSTFETSKHLPAKLPQAIQSFTSKPSPEYITRQEKSQTKQILAIIGYIFFTIFMYAVFGGMEIFMWLVLSSIIYSLAGNKEDKEIRETLTEKLSRLRREINALENKWTNLIKSPKADKEINQIRGKVEEYKRLQQKSISELKNLRADNHRRELNKHLHSFKLADADVEGIDKEAKSFLIGKNIITAKQIEQNRLNSIGNIDVDLSNKLLDWRGELESNFQPAPQKLISEKQKSRFFDQIADKRQFIEKDIEKLLSNLRSSSTHLKRKQTEFFTKSEKLSQEILQTEVNIETLAEYTPVKVVLIVLLILMPVIGIFVNANSSSNSKIKSLPPYTYDTDGDNAEIKALPMGDAKTNFEDGLPDGSLTDEKISKMSESDRKTSVSSLLERGRAEIARKEYTEAEKTLNYAFKFDKENIEVLSELGYLYYEWGEYSTAMKRFQQLLDIDSTNLNARSYIGINHLRLKNYQEARDILLEVTKKDGSNVTFFNLGLAYKGLNNFELAAAAFEKSIEFIENDVDAHYELAFAFYKLKDTESFSREYGKLTDLDTSRAEQLLRNTYKVKPAKNAPPFTSSKSVEQLPKQSKR